MATETQITKQLVSLLESLGDQGSITFVLDQTSNSLEMDVRRTVVLEGREETKLWCFHTAKRAISLMPTPDHLLADGLETAKRVFRNLV